jgi:glutathione S-transferase
MITLYHCANTRSFRALWALEEIGLDYELKMQPFPPRFLAREYLEINPLGTIPYLIDGETRMTESSAICLYLAERYRAAELTVATDEPAYGAYLNGLFFGEATLTFPQTIVLRYSRLEPEERRLPQAATDYARWFLARLRAVDAIVSGQDYYCAGRFTMADISIGYALLFANALGLDGDFSDALRAYRKRLSTRPAFLAAQTAQEQAGIEQGSGEPALTLRFG